MKTIRVLLADDHEIFRNGLRTLIDQETDMEVVGEASNGEEVITLAENANPDVLIIDIRMPKLNGIEASKLITAKNPDLKILIFSFYDNVEYVVQSLDLGAKGYLLKNTSNRILLDAIRAVNRNEFYYIGDVSNSVINYYKNYEHASSEFKTLILTKENLSKKEWEIINLIHEGKNSKEIADILGNSVRTIEAHRHNILAKFSAKNMGQVLSYIQQHL